jgi:hypothetical protein
VSEQHEQTPNADAGQVRTRQPLLPVFAIAFALMGAGFYLALAPDDSGEVDDAREADFGEWEPIDIDAAAIDRQAQAVSLGLQEGQPREVDLFFHQTTRRQADDGTERVLRTNIMLGLSEEIDAADQERFDKSQVWAITRRYERASADITTHADTKISPAITSQVENLLRGSVTRTFAATNGEPLDFEWIEVPNPQARRTLYLVRDGHGFLSPRYFAGQVNAGDTWTYTQPIVVEEPTRGLVASGKVKIESRFVGLLGAEGDQIAVLEQTLDLASEGQFDEETNVAFGLEGAGEGVVLVDVDTGRVRAADITLERSLTVDDEGSAEVFTGQITLGLRPSEGFDLPQPDARGDQEPLEAANEEE